MPPTTTSRLIRFATFQVDFKTGEVRKNGLRIRLQDHPLKVLAMLVDRAGDVVTREELQKSLWSTDTFVDFEHGLNKAVNKLREALGDTAEHPRFIETLPRHGYRLVAKLEVPAPPAPTEDARAARPRRRHWAAMGIVAAGLAIGLGVLLTLNVAGLRGWLLGSPPPRITALAVLPFENLTGDPQQEYFVDGIHDELITQLAQISSLKVISRTSVMRYKKEKPPLREIGRELGAEGVLEGAVRREGGRLQVTAQLISVRDDRHIWAHSYDRDLREASMLSNEVARAVAYKLEAPLAPHEKSLLAAAKPVDPAAYTAYLKGMYFKQKMTNEGYHKAIELFREAIDQDPAYAPAWAAMGESFEMLSGYGIRGEDLSEKEALLKAGAALERAQELDPTLKKPFDVLMRMKLHEWDWEGVATNLQRARVVDPASKGGVVYLTLAGRFDEAVAVAQRAVERNPLAYSTQLILGWTYFNAWRFDESIVALKKAVQMDPKIPHAHYELAWNYAKKGQFNEAISECQLSLELLRQTKPEAVTATECGWVYGLAGRRREALTIARKLEKTAREYWDYTDVAHIYDAVGQREDALRILEKAYQDRDPWLPSQWTVPTVSDELRADPRFQELMRRTGNPWIKFPPAGQSLASTSNRHVARNNP